jgi:putative membrane protein
MIIPMALFWGLVVWGVITVMYRVSRPGGSSIIGESALDVLKKRYAGGDIDRDEFEQKRRDIA